MKCWERFNPEFVLVQVQEKSAGSASTPYYGVNTNWHVDSGATDHIISDLNKLTIRDKYNGNEQVHTASGSGMDIAHIGHSAIKTLDRDLHLNNILHVFEANKSLLSAHRLACDNDAYVEIHPFSFFVKDRAMKTTLL